MIRPVGRGGGERGDHLSRGSPAPAPERLRARVAIILDFERRRFRAASSPPPSPRARPDARYDLIVTDRSVAGFHGFVALDNAGWVVWYDTVFTQDEFSLRRLRVVVKAPTPYATRHRYVLQVQQLHAGGVPLGRRRARARVRSDPGRLVRDHHAHAGHAPAPAGEVARARTPPRGTWCFGVEGKEVKPNGMKIEWNGMGGNENRIESNRIESNRMKWNEME